MAKRVRTHVNPLSITKEYSFSGFGNDRPVIVDVGACKGEFTENLLEKFPEKNFIVFEIRVPLANKLCEKFKEHDNVVVFDGDAGRNFKTIIEACFKDGASLETVYVNFPDPWFKERHKKRRFINNKFLDEAARYISSATEWVFQTDQKFLFDETLEVLEESEFNHVEYFDTPPFGIQTDWEQAKTAEGSAVYRMKFQRADKLTR